jgi:predicted transcriptional regulator of viral defense system
MLAYLQMRGKSTVYTGDLIGPLGLTPEQEHKLLSRMARAGMIARVKRGLYLVPPRLPLGGSWSPDAGLALTTLLDDRQGQYQICGPNAFSRYGFSSQVPTRVYAYNNRISGERRIGAVELTLIKVADRRLGDTEQVRTVEGPETVYCSRVRTLLDAVYDWSRFASLPQGFDWIRDELASGRVEAEELVRVTLRYGDIGTIRRTAALLAREGEDPGLLRRLERALSPSSSLIPWIPTRPKRGRADRRWGIVWND